MALSSEGEHACVSSTYVQFCCRTRGALCCHAHALADTDVHGMAWHGMAGGKQLRCEFCRYRYPAMGTGWNVALVLCAPKCNGLRSCNVSVRPNLCRGLEAQRTVQDLVHVGRAAWGLVYPVVVGSQAQSKVIACSLLLPYLLKVKHGQGNILAWIRGGVLRNLGGMAALHAPDAQDPNVNISAL